MRHAAADLVSVVNLPDYGADDRGSGQFVAQLLADVHQRKRLHQIVLPVNRSRSAI
jgi:hypothetical protein